MRKKCTFLLIHHFYIDKDKYKTQKYYSITYVYSGLSLYRRLYLIKILITFSATIDCLRYTFFHNYQHLQPSIQMFILNNGHYFHNFLPSLISN